MSAQDRTDAFAWLETNQENMVADLIELANQNSGSDNLNGLLLVADWLEDWFGIHPAVLQRIPLPPRRMVADDGGTTIIETGPALRWDFQPDNPRRVLLAIHYDTVYGLEHPFQACHRLTNDRLGGPGVADAKGGIVVLRYALQALLRFSLTNDCGWTVLLNPDEEVGSTSSNQVMQDMAADFDFGLLLEPCLPNGDFVSHRKGSGNFTMVIHGRSAHAGRDFHQGRNAVAKLCGLLSEIDQWNGLRSGLTINVGRVAGGGPVNVVPDLAVGRFNVRLEDKESEIWLEQKLKSLVTSANQAEGFRCELHGSISSPSKPITDQSKQIMIGIEESARELGQVMNWRSTGGVCDGNKLAAAGLPNIDTLGPLGDGLHSPQEWVQVSSLVAKSKLLVEILSRFSSGRLESLERSKLTIT